MAKTINLVWALPVDTATLAARLEAFLETRAVPSTLCICAKKKGSPIPAHLPLKNIDKIANIVKDSCYESKIRGWLTAVDCITGNCWNTRRGWSAGSHGSNSDDFDGEILPDDSRFTDQDVHCENVNAYLKKIARFEERKEACTNTPSLPTVLGSTSFGNHTDNFRSQMLISIFGISPDFRLLKASNECNTISDSDEWARQTKSCRDFKRRIPTAFSSYLTLSTGENDILLQHEKGPNAVSYAVKQEISPSSLQPLEDDKIALFASAIETLKLDSAHTYIMVDDKVKDEWPWSESQSDAEPPSGDDSDIPRSAKPVKKQHVECLECGTAVCKGQRALPKKKPELMLLGWGKLEAYDAEELGSGYFHALS